MAKVAVVYHSGYGHTQRMAEAVAVGAGATLLAIDAEGNLPESSWDALNAADAMAQSPSDSSPAEMLPGDLETARLFGQRVAAVAAKIRD